MDKNRDLTTKISEGHIDNRTDNSVKLIIPQGMTHVNYNTLNNITNFELHDGRPSKAKTTEYDTAAFNAKVTSIRIPNSVEYIDDETFAAYPNLQEITVAKDNAKYKSVDGMLLSADGKRLIACCIGNEHIKIPEGVEVISRDAFIRNNNVVSITFPSTIKEIDQDYLKRFSGLREVHVAEGNPEYSSKDGVLFSDGGKTLFYYPERKKDNFYEVPDGVTRIASCAFSHNAALTKVAFPDSLTYISNYAFDKCPNLAEATNFKGVKGIEYSSFHRTAIYNNPELWDKGVLYLENCLIHASSDAFHEYGFEIREGTTTIASRALDYYASGEIVIPESVTAIGSYAIYDQSNIDKIIIEGENLEYVGREALAKSGPVYVDSAKVEEVIRQNDVYGNTDIRIPLELGPKLLDDEEFSPLDNGDKTPDISRDDLATDIPSANNDER